LKMVTENANWRSDGMDLQYVKVYAVDSKDRVVPTFDGEATFDIAGEAKLIAVDNGDHSSDELFAGTKRKMYKGFAMAILRAKQTAGTVNVRVSVRGLNAAEIILNTK